MIKLKRTYGIFMAVCASCTLLLSCIGGVKKNAGNDNDTPTARSFERQVISISDSLLQHRGADTVYMGRMHSGEVVSRTVNFVNAGDKPVVVLRIAKTCGCVELDYPRVPLKPGEQSEMTFTFDSAGLEGWIYKTLSISTSLGTKEYILVVTADIE